MDREEKKRREKKKKGEGRRKKSEGKADERAVLHSPDKISYESIPRCSVGRETAKTHIKTPRKKKQRNDNKKMLIRTDKGGGTRSHIKQMGREKWRDNSSPHLATCKERNKTGNAPLSHQRENHTKAQRITQPTDPTLHQPPDRHSHAHTHEKEQGQRAEGVGVDARSGCTKRRRSKGSPDN